MDITINTPALLFPAISLIMLAYTNRFMTISSVIRNLHARYTSQLDEPKPLIHAQIKNLRYRLNLVKNMQILGVCSFLLAIICMYLIYINKMEMARITFASSMILLMASLLISLLEIIKSTNSLEIELSDMENLEDPTFVDYLKKKWKS